MARRTLIDFFADLAAIDGEFLSYDDGYRTWTYTYQDTVARARAFAAHLHENGLAKGDHVVVWSENRPEWIMALWGCLLRGVVLVPIDYRASPDFLRKVAAIVEARAILVGDTVPAPFDGMSADAGSARPPVWPLAGLATSTSSAVIPPIENGPD